MIIEAPLVAVGTVLKVQENVKIGGQEYILEVHSGEVVFTNVGLDAPLFCDGYAVRCTFSTEIYT